MSSRRNVQSAGQLLQAATSNWSGGFGVRGGGSSAVSSMTSTTWYSPGGMSDGTRAVSVPSAATVAVVSIVFIGTFLSWRALLGDNYCIVSWPLVTLFQAATHAGSTLSRWMPPGPLVAKADAEPPSELGATAGGEGGRRLVPHLDEADAVPRLARGLHDPVDAVAGQPEDHLHTPVNQPLDQHIRRRLGHDTPLLGRALPSGSRPTAPLPGRRPVTSTHRAPAGRRRRR